MDYYNGVVKVKDGLFMGNCETGEDLDFITDNKITRIINCAGYELTNLFESSGVKYLTFNWLDNGVQLIFDADDSVIHQITSFIDESLEKGESCLVWSVNGCSRSACVICGYLMIKFSWSLYKSLEYLNSKFQSLSLSPNFLHQLFNLQERLLSNHQKPLTCTWEVQTSENDDLLLQNTFLNSKSPKILLPPRPLKSPGVLTWSERLLAGKENKQEGQIIVRSCLKGKTENSFIFTPSRGSSTEISFRSDSESRKENIKKKNEIPLQHLKSSKNQIDFLLKNRENSTKNLETSMKDKENMRKLSEKSESDTIEKSERVKSSKNTIKTLKEPEETLKTQTLKDVSGLLNTGTLNQSSKAVKTLKSFKSRTVRTPSPVVFSDIVLQQNRLRRPWR